MKSNFTKADWESYKVQMETTLKRDIMNVYIGTKVLTWIAEELKKFPKEKNATDNSDKGNKA